MQNPVLYEEFSQNIVYTKGEQRYDSFSYPYHLHPRTEFFMLLSGEMTLLTEENIRMREGDAVLISPLVIHGYRSEGPVSFCFMVFEDPVFSDVQNMEAFGSGSCVLIFNTAEAFPDGELDEIAGRVILHRRQDHGALLTLYCRILLTLALDLAFSADDRPKLLIRTDRKPFSLAAPDPHSIAAAVLPYIQMHYREKITLSEMSRIIRSNEYTVSRALNRDLHASFSEIVNRYRIQEACALLRKTNDSVQKIAERVGYETVSTFNRNFLKYAGTTPRRYRRTNG